MRPIFIHSPNTQGCHSTTSYVTYHVCVASRVFGKRTPATTTTKGCYLHNTTLPWHTFKHFKNCASYGGGGVIMTHSKSLVMPFEWDSSSPTNAINLFFHCVDTAHVRPQSADDFTNLFTEDAILRFPYRNIFKQGRKELKALCQFMSDSFKGCSHVETNIVITPIGENTVRSASYWNTWKEGQMISMGRHYDVLVRDTCEGMWRFKERLITMSWTREEGNVEEREQY